MQSPGLHKIKILQTPEREIFSVVSHNAIKLLPCQEINDQMFLFIAVVYYRVLHVKNNIC